MNLTIVLDKKIGIAMLECIASLLFDMKSFKYFVSFSIKSDSSQKK